MKAFLVVSALLVSGLAHANTASEPVPAVETHAPDVCAEGSCDPVPAENLAPLKLDPQPIDLLEYKPIPESRRPVWAEMV